VYFAFVFDHVFGTRFYILHWEFYIEILTAKCKTINVKCKSSAA
jgi:hypothetical protein